MPPFSFCVMPGREMLISGQARFLIVTFRRSTCDTCRYASLAGASYRRRAYFIFRRDAPYDAITAYAL